VREDVLGSQWVVRDENIPAEACAAKRGFCHQLPETNYDDNVWQTTIRNSRPPRPPWRGPVTGNNEQAEDGDRGCHQ